MVEASSEYCKKNYREIWLTALWRSHLSPNTFLKPSKKQLIHQRSAPGTPLSPQRPSARTPSRTPSDDSAGLLSVPRARARVRGSSFSGDSPLTTRKVLTSFKKSHFCS